MKKCIVYLSIVFLITGCKNKSLQKTNDIVLKPKALLTIDIERDFENEKELRLSEIANDIEYVKLEKTPTSLVGGENPKWYITKEHIFVYSRQRLLQFDRSGKFIHEIGKNGKGPGEFINMKGMTLDGSGLILLIRPIFKQEVLKYDIITGDYIGSFNVRDYMGTSAIPRSFQHIGANRFAAISEPSSQFSSDYILLEIIDGEGNSLASLKSFIFSKEYNKQKRFPQVPNQIWFYKNKYRLYEALNDTIFNIIHDKLEPAYMFNLGKYKGSFDEMTTKYRKELSDKIIPFGFWETQNYLFFCFNYLGKLRTAIFDKTNERFFKIVNNPQDEFNPMINDIDGGLSFWPWYSVDHSNDEWIYWVDAIDLKQKLTEEYFKNSEAIYPEKKEELKKYVNELSIDDNPVLMIVKLKV